MSLIANHFKEFEYSLLKSENTSAYSVVALGNTGSRTWGFASTDSDYDYTGVFLNVSKNAYVSQFEQEKQTISLKLDDTVSGTFQDFKKFMGLLYNSNAQCWELFYSQDSFDVLGLKDFVKDQLSNNLRKLLGNYYGVAKSFKNPRSEYQTKRVLYTMRAVFAFKFMIQNPGLLPELNVGKQLESVDMKSSTRRLVEDALELKVLGVKNSWNPEFLDSFLFNEVEQLEQSFNSIQDSGVFKTLSPSEEQYKKQEFNRFYRQVVLK